MKKVLGAGLYCCKTADEGRQVEYLNANWELRAKKIVVGLELQLKRLEDFYKREGIVAFGLQGVFVAPEYLFSAGNGIGGVRGVPKYQKEAIVSMLKSLSKDHDRTLIIPGSICWYDTGTGTGKRVFKAGGGGVEIPIVAAKAKWKSSEKKIISLAEDGGGEGEKRGKNPRPKLEGGASRW